LQALIVSEADLDRVEHFIQSIIDTDDLNVIEDGDQALNFTV